MRLIHQEVDLQHDLVLGSDRAFLHRFGRLPNHRPAQVVPLRTRYRRQRHGAYRIELAQVLLRLSSFLVQLHELRRRTGCFILIGKQRVVPGKEFARHRIHHKHHTTIRRPAPCTVAQLVVLTAGRLAAGQMRLCKPAKYGILFQMHDVADAVALQLVT